MLATNQTEMIELGLKGYIKKINSRSIDFEFHARTYQLNKYGVITHKSFNDGKAWYSFAHCDFSEAKDLALLLRTEYPMQFDLEQGSMDRVYLFKYPSKSVEIKTLKLLKQDLSGHNAVDNRALFVQIVLRAGLYDDLKAGKLVDLHNLSMADYESCFAVDEREAVTAIVGRRLRQSMFVSNRATEAIGKDAVYEMINLSKLLL
jgi:hypothetical protein